MALTRRQRETYDFVREFIVKHGYSPSLEEIGGRLELSSVATVHKHVNQLVAKGWLRKSWNRARSLEPVDATGRGEVTLPLLGVVAAGEPIEPIEVAERIAVPAGLVRRPETCFALRVRGDSMIDEQIRDGDTVVVERRSEARDGETVVAVLRGEEATLKKLQRRGATVRLTRAIDFSSSLRCCCPDLSEAENEALYGPAARQHGHNYRLEVTVCGVPDPGTGMVVDLKELKAVLEREIVVRFDHRDLNRDTPFFEKVPPTPEHLALVVFDLLRAALGPLLHGIRLRQDEDLWVDVRDSGARRGAPAKAGGAR